MQQQFDEKESSSLESFGLEVPTLQENGQQLSLDYNVKSFWLEMYVVVRVDAMVLSGTFSGKNGKGEKGSGPGAKPWR